MTTTRAMTHEQIVRAREPMCCHCPGERTAVPIPLFATSECARCRRPFRDQLTDRVSPSGGFYLVVRTDGADRPGSGDRGERDRDGAVA